MVITSIEKQKKKGRYNIFLNGEFSFGAYEDTILKFALRKGDDLPEEKITEIKDFDEFNYGKTASYRLLSYRQRSEKEIKDKLKEKKISPENIGKVIDKLKDLKFIDDKTFAKNYITDQINKKPAGRTFLKYKLLQKGIDKTTSEETIKVNYTEEKELNNAVLLVSKYSKKVRGTTEQDKKRKCYQYLLSRGFTYDVASQALQIANNK